MHTSSMEKKEFLKKWIQGLEICCSTNKHMNVMERKKKIKLCADIAMVSSKKTATSWSNALISNAKQNEQDTILVNKLLGTESQLKLQKNTTSCHKKIFMKRMMKMKKKIKKNKKMGTSGWNSATVIAKRLVKKRTKVLKRLVPGGESMDEFSLIKEALDYIISLKGQVDVMRSVVAATDQVLSDGKLLKFVE